MAGNILSLTTRVDQTNRETIEILRDFLEMAERGEVVAVAIAAIEPSGASRTQASATDNMQGLLGGVAILHHKMLKNTE